ncbi:antitoxin [archaeon]|nr:antitoxin [archaeon]|tara:strand:+ start:1007 stop:1246 length:240 start_codon:yes stop_codon:yes gene_type:complete
MPQAIIKLNEHEDRVLNIVKGKYGLKNKSQAINLVIEKYEKEFIEPELRPEYIEKLKRIQKEKPIKIGSINDFKKRYEE